MRTPAASAPREVPIASWSNACKTTTRLAPWPGAQVQSRAGDRWIARGAGRSFGDAAFITGGTTFSSAGMSWVEMDVEGCEASCGAGTPLLDLHRTLERTGLECPVYGGTQWVTVGGAVASDIHGKNDPAVGSFGNHVESLVVTTAGQAPIECSRRVHADLFAATIGGMGLTGFIESVKLRLRPAAGRHLRIRAALVSSVADMLALFRETPSDFQVCDWMLPAGMARHGVFWYASYTAGAAAAPRYTSNLWLPRWKLINSWSVRAMELAVLRLARRLDTIQHIRRFNYGGGHEIFKNWNRLFGQRGFIEYHFALDEARFAAGFETLVELSRRRAAAPAFGVVKRFGTMPREGLLSFPLAGYGMNFQIENRDIHRRFLSDLTDALLDLGGRVYLAKDAVASASQVERMYPRLAAWQRAVRHYDPRNRVQSDLSRRLRLKPWCN